MHAVAASQHGGGGRRVLRRGGENAAIVWAGDGHTMPCL